MGANFTTRVDQARRELTPLAVGGLLVTHLPNILYLCGFTGSNAIVLLLPDAVHLFTDGRYTTQAHEEAPNTRIHIERKALVDAVGSFLKARRGGMRIGFDPIHINMSEWARLKEASGKRVRWKEALGLVERMREVKDAGELETMREAARIGSEVMAEVLQLARPGLTELELAAEVDYRMRRKGASGPSFDTIVASGPRAALPHAHPSEKRLQKNELVVFDLGAILRNYCSDLTRTIYLGRATPRIRQWYRAVEEAQHAGLAALKVDATAGNVDRVTRRVLEGHRLGRYFVHGTGHGVGIEIHETPRVGRRQQQRIRAGNVVTLEPGIYIEGVGGIRIEDEVAVHAHGTEILTSAPRGLLEL
jgi:Xaa-Pro aminopeptidase